MLNWHGDSLARVRVAALLGKLLLVAIDHLRGMLFGAALGCALAVLHANLTDDGLEMRENEARVVRALGAVSGEFASSCSEEVADLHASRCERSMKNRGCR